MNRNTLAGVASAASGMQWHWGNIGSFLAGFATLIVAIAALIRGPAVVRAWAERMRAQTALAVEEAETVMLDRRRHLSGWSGHGVDTFGVSLVSAKDELEQACKEIASGEPSAYVVLRISEGGGDGHDANRARSLTQIIESDAYISRPPTTGEREALEAGLDAMRIPRAAHGRTRL